MLPWNESLHPRQGGKFAPKGTGSTGSTAPAAGRPAGGKSGKKSAPNGLGYSAKQWGNLQKLEASAHAGKKLDAHQLHELHVAHEKHLAAAGIIQAKTKATPKPKTARPKATPKPKRAVAPGTPRARVVAARAFTPSAKR